MRNNLPVNISSTISWILDAALRRVSPRPPDCYTAPPECCWEGWKGTQLCKESPTSLLMKFMREQKKGRVALFPVNTQTPEAKMGLRECCSLPAQHPRACNSNLCREGQVREEELLSWSPGSVTVTGFFTDSFALSWASCWAGHCP